MPQLSSSKVNFFFSGREELFVIIQFCFPAGELSHVTSRRRLAVLTQSRTAHSLNSFNIPRHTRKAYRILHDLTQHVILPTFYENFKLQDLNLDFITLKFIKVYTLMLNEFCRRCSCADSRKHIRLPEHPYDQRCLCPCRCHRIVACDCPCISMHRWDVQQFRQLWRWTKNDLSWWCNRNVNEK